MNGINLYEMHWELEVEVLADCLMNPSTLEASLPAKGLEFLLHVGKRPAKRGDKFSMTGITTSMKSEKGWENSEMTIKTWTARS